MKTIYILLLLFSFQSIFAQSNKPITTVNPGDSYEYSGAQIMTNNFEKIKADKIWIKNDKVIYQKKNTYINDSIPLSEVRQVRAETGNYAIEGLLIGALIPCLAALQVSLDPDTYVVPERFMIALGIGSGLGLLIGAVTSKVSTLYQGGQFKLTLFEQNYQLYNEHYYNTKLISLNYQL